MKKFLCLFVLFIIAGILSVVFSQETKNEIPFYNQSLHYYAHGMAYWYSKENGGLEKLTGIPYDKLMCNKCHAQTCDRCHRVESDGIFLYSIKRAKSKENCLECHGRHKLMLTILEKNSLKEVHFSKGLECMNCHTAREIHGNGKKYVSMRQQGAMEIKCENCHQNRPDTFSHKIHKDKLDCTACHVRQVITCANCHMDTMIKTGKRISIPLYGWVFLINYNGKVVSGNIQTFVVGENKTFIIFAPYNSHDIAKEGKRCEECHATDIVNQIKNGKIEITWIENVTLKNLKGVIPIVEGVEYKNSYMNYINDNWVPLENPEPPLTQFVAFGEPLNKEQLKRLLIPFKSKQ